MDVSISWGYFACTDVFVATDVSARPWYLLLQMLFFRPMYLQDLNIFCCRCSLSWPMYLQLAFLRTCRYFSACLSCTITSASCLFLDLKILPLQILHLHPTFSITWRCSPVKLRILNLLFQCFADAPIKILHLQSPIADIVARYPLSSIYCSIRSAVQNVDRDLLLQQLWMR